MSAALRKMAERCSQGMASQASRGCQNNTYKNWETSTVPYTAEDYARFEAEFNS